MTDLNGNPRLRAGEYAVPSMNLSPTCHVEVPRSPDEPARLVTLDGWRAVGALIVVAAHVEQYSSIKGALAAFPRIDGKFGVELFFGISGFVICRSLIAESRRAGHVSLVAFYIRRLFRIVPPLAAYVMVVVILAHFGVVEESAAAAAKGLTFTCNLPDARCGGQLGAHLWSLSVEEQFYLVVPIMIAITNVRSKAALTVAILLFPMLVICLYADKLLWPANILINFATISFGVLCALHESRVRSIVTALPVWTVLLTISALLVLRELPPAPVTTVLRLVAQPPLIMYTLLGSTYRRWIVADFLSSRPMQLLGATSYSFYLWQQLATFAFPGAGIWFYIASVSGCFGVSIASRHWFEKPLMKVGARVSEHIQSRRLAGNMFTRAT